MVLSWFDPGIHHMPSFKLNKDSHQLQVNSPGKYAEGAKKECRKQRSDLHLVRMPGSIGIARCKRYKSWAGSRGTALCRTATASAYLESRAKFKGVKPESGKL